MKIIASWNYSEDLDQLIKVLKKEYERLTPKGYTVTEKRSPIAFTKDGIDRKVGYISYIVGNGEFTKEIGSSIPRNRIISLLNTYFSDYLVKRLAATTDKDGEYYNFELEIKRK